MSSIRRRAFTDLSPDVGPDRPHPTAGATAVGARSVLVAYNVWLATSDLELAKEIARGLREPAVRALGLQVGDGQLELHGRQRAGERRVGVAVHQDPVGSVLGRLAMAEVSSVDVAVVIRAEWTCE